MKVVNNVSTERLHTFPVTKSRRYKVPDGKMMETEEMIIVPQLPSNEKYKKKKYPCSRYMISKEILYGGKRFYIGSVILKINKD